MDARAGELVFTAAMVLATLLGLAVTLLGLFLDVTVSVAVVVGLVALGALSLPTDRVVAGVLGALSALLGGVVAPLVVVEFAGRGVVPLSLLAAGLVVGVGLVGVRVARTAPRTAPGPHA